MTRNVYDKLEHRFISGEYYTPYKYYDTMEKQIKLVAFPSSYEQLKTMVYNLTFKATLLMRTM